MSGMDRLTMDGAREVRDELHAIGLDGDLFMRLTGFYRVGPDGPVEPEFGYRDFTGSDLRQPIQTDAAAMIRELLAHRRASQAAPAPSEPTGDRAVLAQVLRTRGKANSLHDIMRAADFLDAPAPSDGLREAAMALCEAYRDGMAAIGSAFVHKALLDCEAALSASPAQEGGE